MRQLTLAAVYLLIIVLAGVWLHHRLAGSDEPSSYEDPLDISFKVTGQATKPVDFVTFDLVVKREGDDQVKVKAECDAAAEELLTAFKEAKGLTLDPRGIEVDKATDYETRTSKLFVSRSFGLRLEDVAQMEQTITRITRIPGCLIRSTEYHSNRLPEIRRAAVEDAKQRMDEQCRELLQMHPGRTLEIDRIRIEDDDRWSGGGMALMAMPVNETLQNAQMMKNVEVKISYDVDVQLFRKPRP